MDHPGMVLPKVPRSFWLLAATLCMIFLLGGSSQANLPSLMILRPATILIAGYALLTLPASQWRQHRHLAWLTAAILLLVILHLVPLPPAIWHALPGRDVVRNIDRLAGLTDQWRPLTMVPSATRNALYSLAAPIALMALAARQNRRGHIYLGMLVIVLVATSGLIGLMQASGVNISLYSRTSDFSGLFSNRNHQGVLLTIILPFLAVVTVTATRVGLVGRWAWIAACSIAAMIVPLVLITGSRAALGTGVLAVAVIPLLGLWVHGRGGRSRTGLILVGGGVVFAAVVVAFVMISARDSGIDRIGATGIDPRYPVWVSIVNALPGFLPWGTGVGSYAPVYQIVEPSTLLRPTFSNHAHNEYLEILFTAGLPGVALLLWAMTLWLMAVWKSFTTTAPAAPFCRLGLAIIAIIAFASTVDYPARTPIIASILAIAAIWASSFRTFNDEIERE